VPSGLLGFSPLAGRLSLSGLCENLDAAALEGTPVPPTRVQGAADSATASIGSTFAEARPLTTIVSRAS
jgi:hypothetical protein